MSTKLCVNEVLSSLERIDLREVWQDEARDFTPWLSSDEGCQLLSDALGIELGEIETEQSVGSYRVDFVAREGNSDHVVIVENQLDVSDHKHLGQLIAYSSGLNASAIVWICSQLRDEHRQALHWLNENTKEEVAFFGLEIELWKIASSQPAPKFNIVVQPNDWARTLRSTNSAINKEQSRTKQAQLAFWQKFIEFCRANSSKLNLRRPYPQHWYSMSIGRSGFELSLTINTRENRIGCEIYMHKEVAEKAFFFLKQESAYIEKQLDCSLEWQELPGKGASRIAIYRDCNFQDEDNWGELIEWLEKRATSFRAVLQPIIKRIESTSAA